VSAAATTVATAAEPTATAVESAAAAAEAATTVVTTTAHAIGMIAARSAARETVCATGVSTRPGIANAAAIPNPAAIPKPTAIAYPTVEAATVEATTVVSPIPGPGADKETAYEPTRSVVAVGRAGVRIIRIVAPGTNRSGIPVTVIAIPAIADTDSDLGVRRRSRHQR
jgi:hypothetical protein